MARPTGEIALGITEDQIALGSHLIHFWQTEEEFERGVRFLDLGIASECEYCVLFGHDEANQRVSEILSKKDVIWIVWFGKNASSFCAASLRHR